MKILTYVSQHKGFIGWGVGEDFGEFHGYKVKKACEICHKKFTMTHGLQLTCDTCAKRYIKRDTKKSGYKKKHGKLR